MYNRTNIALTLGLVVICVWYATTLSYDIFFSYFWRIKWEFFVFSCVFAVLSIYFEGLGWRYMLKRLWPGVNLPVTTVLHLHYASISTGLLLPSGGVSELGTRLWLARRQLGIPPEESFSSMLLFRLLFFCTTFISTFLFFTSLYLMEVISFES